MERKTVFVVGAGASNEFGLPLGTHLQTLVADMVNISFRDGIQRISGDEEIYQACRRRVQSNGEHDPNPYFRAGRLVSDGVQLTDSIDNFMKKHGHDEKVQFLGKLGIVKAICTAERNSSLFVDQKYSSQSLNIQGVKSTWLFGLFKHLQRGIDFPDRAKIFDDVSFIVFNYDRCVEYFLMWALMLAYDISEQEASEIVASANIYHPYGHLGHLPRFSNVRAKLLPFGADPFSLEDIAGRIITYTESIEDTDRLEKARSWIRDCEQIAFLGTAYHPQNLDILSVEGQLRGKHILGTAYGFSEYDRTEIESDLLARFRQKKTLGKINLAETKCAELINNFSRAFI